MISKPSRLALSGMAFVCAGFLAACNNDSARLQFLTVAPKSGEIYASATVVGGVRGAARQHARPALQGNGSSPRRPAAIIPPPVTATCGSLQYAATALFSNGTTQDVSSSATWTSSNTSVASISSTGLASGIGLGTTNIGASFKGVSATSEPLAVDQLNSITLSPPNPTIALGLSQSFVAIGNFTFAAGGSGDLDVSSQVTWNSSNTNVATIDSSGNATSVGQGSTNITATSCDGITVGKTILTVGPPAPETLKISPAAPTISTGTTILFTALELLSDGTTQPLTGAVTWASGTTTTATIDAKSGVALGLAVGTSTITATEAGTGFTGTTTLTVQAAAARFAYVADAQGGASFSGTISGYKVDVTSATPLTPLAGSPVTASTPQQVLLHPSGDLMYYIDGGGSVHVDDINSTDGSFSEALLLVPTPAVLPGSKTTNVGVIDPTGRFLYVISDGDNTIFGFSITQTADKAPATNGALTAIPSFNPYTDANLNSPTWIMTDRSGKYVYVVNNVGNTISEYSIDQTTGALSPLATPTIGTGNAPFYGTTDVNGHLYVANEGPPQQSVSGYTIDTTTGSTAGQLTQIGSGPFLITGATFTINVITDPTGKYLYVLDSTSGPPPPTAPLSHVFAFNLNPATGVIGTQIGTPQLTGNSPFGMAIDPTGVLMAIDNNFDNNISLFTIGSASSTTPGGLTPTNPPIVGTDNQPLFVVFYTAASGQ